MTKFEKQQRKQMRLRKYPLLCSRLFGFGIFFFALGLVLSVLVLTRDDISENAIDFNTTPAAGLTVGQYVNIAVEEIYDRFATVTINSGSPSTSRPKNYTTTRLYYAIRTMDGKVMALAIDPEFENEVNLRQDNTIARSLRSDSENAVAPLLLTGIIYEIDRWIYEGENMYTPTIGLTVPSNALNSYINIEPEFENAEVYPYVLAVIRGNDEISIAERNSDAAGVLVLFAAVSIIGAGMVIFSVIKHKKRS